MLICHTLAEGVEGWKDIESIDQCLTESKRRKEQVKIQRDNIKKCGESTWSSWLDYWRACSGKALISHPAHRLNEAHNRWHDAPKFRRGLQEQIHKIHHHDNGLLRLWYHYEAWEMGMCGGFLYLSKGLSQRSWTWALDRPRNVFARMAQGFSPREQHRLDIGITIVPNWIPIFEFSLLPIDWLCLALPHRKVLFWD